MTANVTAEVRVYRKYYRDVVAIVRKVCIVISCLFILPAVNSIITVFITVKTSECLHVADADLWLCHISIGGKQQPVV